MASNQSGWKMGRLRTGWGGRHGIRLASRREEEGGGLMPVFESDENRWFDNNTQTVGPVESPVHRCRVVVIGLRGAGIDTSQVTIRGEDRENDRLRVTNQAAAS